MMMVIIVLNIADSFVPYARSIERHMISRAAKMSKRKMAPSDPSVLPQSGPTLFLGHTSESVAMPMRLEIYPLKPFDMAAAPNVFSRMRLIAAILGDTKHSRSHASAWKVLKVK